MKYFFSSLLATLFIFNAGAQKDWATVDIENDYKRKVSISGAAAKSLKNNPTFVSFYAVSQATTMTGSNSSATKAVYSEISIGGLENNQYQAMVDELYDELIADLGEAGLNITDGAEVLESDFVKDKASKDKNGEFIGKAGTLSPYDGKKKATDGAIPGYGAWAVTRDVTFPGSKMNYYYTTDLLKSYGFYAKLAAKEGINILMVNYFVSFASFEGNKGYKDIKLATTPVMAVSVKVTLFTANGSANEIAYKKMPMWGSGDWALETVTDKDNKNSAEFLGLARSAEYSVTADPSKYTAEAKSMIGALQKDIVKSIKESL